MIKDNKWETPEPLIVSYPSIHLGEMESELERQRAEHKSHGATRFNEGDVVTLTGPRHGLEEATKACAKRRGSIMASHAYRVARTPLELFNTLIELKSKDVILEILDFGGRKVRSDELLQITLLEIAEAFKTFERSSQLLRQREGIARAKEKRRYKGRHPSAQLQRDEIWKRFVELRQPASQIAEALSISVPSVYRIARDVDAEKAEQRRQNAER